MMMVPFWSVGKLAGVLCRGTPFTDAVPVLVAAVLLKDRNTGTALAGTPACVAVSFTVTRDPGGSEPAGAMGSGLNASASNPTACAGTGNSTDNTSPRPA